VGFILFCDFFYSVFVLSPLNYYIFYFILKKKSISSLHVALHWLKIKFNNLFWFIFYKIIIMLKNNPRIELFDFIKKNCFDCLWKIRMSGSKLIMREKRMVFFSFLLLFKSRFLNFFVFGIVWNFFFVLLVFVIFVLIHNFILFIFQSLN